MTTSKEVQISAHMLGGSIDVSQFNLVDVELPELATDQVLVRNLYMSVDPYMRGRMVNAKSYIDPFSLNKALEGGAVGVVEQSKNSNFKVGDLVSSFNGWRERFVSDCSNLDKLPNDLKNASNFLGPLGMPGLTAYGSLLTIGKIKEGETVFVSSAAGAVGSIVCQIAKLKGCKVIASAGSDEKVEWLKNELKVDAAFNYKHCDTIDSMLKELAPQGIDVYFENVGGEHLHAAIENMNLYGRIVMCGMISNYNADKPVPGPDNLMQIVGKRLTMQGFLVFDFEPMKADFYRDMSSWLASGELKTKETIVSGLDSAPSAFAGLFTGDNFGKMVVKISD